MALSKKQAGSVAGLVLVLLIAVAVPFARPAYRRWHEDERWALWLDDAFGPNPATHAEHWDALNKPLDKGGLPLLPWAHFTLAKVPRQSFRVRAWFRVSQAARPAWIRLIAASPVEYISVPDAGSSQELPRSRWAGFVGRLDRAPQGSSLSVGQEDRQGQAVNMAVGAAAPLLGEEVLQMTDEDQHLTLQWGSGHVETLARALFVGQTPDLQFGLAGENILVTRLQVWVRKDPGNLKAEAEADGYALVGKPQMSEPIYRDLALAQNDPSARARYELSQASALDLGVHRDDAVAVLKAMIFRDPGSFYTGYARMDLEGVREKQGASVAELGDILQGLYQGQAKHPEAGAARLRHAQLLAQDPATLAQARSLALDALGCGDPSVESRAVDLLSQQSTAIPPEALVAALEPLAQRPGASTALAEALALQKARLLASKGDLGALVQTCVQGLNLPLETRQKAYQILADQVEKQFPKEASPADLELALAGLSPQSDYTPHPDIDAMVRDFLSVMGLAYYRSPEAMQTVRPALRSLALLLRHHVRLHPGLIPSAPTRAWLDPQRTPLPQSYGSLPQAPPSQDGDETCLVFRSGSYWGCGLSFAGTQGPRLPSGDVDLSGYRYLQAELWAPKDCEVYLSISESGVDDPKSESFAGAQGADGEQYLFPGLRGTGEWQSLKLPLDDVGPALNWGNLQGNHTLDLQAIRKIDVAIPGQQGIGRLCLRKVRFSVD